MLIWLIVQVLAAFLCVVGPFVMQARESLHPPMNTPSLGTFGIIMMASFYFVCAGSINSVIIGSRLEWPWFGTALLAVAAAATGAVIPYVLLYAMATRGGRAVTALGGIGLAAMLAINLVCPWLA